MAWNEPGGGGDKKDSNQDPWSGRPKKQGPTDLDKLLSDFQKKVTGVIGNKNGKGESSLPPAKSSGILLFGILVLLLIIWIAMGFFKVQEAEKAVILRFGKFEKTIGAGLHWIPIFIDTQYRINIAQRDAYTYSSKMLTKDENIVSVGVAVQYRKSDPEAYLFNVTDPVESLEQATASALRQTVGNMKLDDILTRGRDKVSKDSEKLLKAILEKYAAGIEVTNFTLDIAKPPEEVQEAFDDVIKAGQDKERYAKKAEAYAAQINKEAEGDVAKILADANAYKEQVILIAKGDIANFLAILPEYRLSPDVTRERLYLSTMEAVLKASSKILLDVNNNNNVIYLPLDKILPPKALAPLEEEVDIKTEVNSSSNKSRPADTSSKAPSPQQAENNALERGYLSFSRQGRTGYSTQESP